MFTGIIEEVGRIESVRRRAEGLELRIAAAFARELKRGESIAVDGVCLTAESCDAAGFVVFASPETLAKTTLEDRRTGDAVNLERALAFGERLGGHLVSGHVDTTGRLQSIRQAGDSREIWFEAPHSILRTSIPKGSIAVDGISLTIVELTKDAFSAWIIPETWERTILSRRAAGSRVNLESDLIGKHVARLMNH